MQMQQRLLDVAQHARPVCQVWRPRTAMPVCQHSPKALPMGAHTQLACHGRQRPTVRMCAHQLIADLAAASYGASRQPAGRPAGQYVQPQVEQEEEEEEEEEEEGQEEGQEEGAEEEQGEQQEEKEGAPASEATLQAAKAKEAEDELVTQEVTEEIEVWDKPMTFQSVATDTVQWVRDTNPGKAAAVTVAGMFVGTFVLALYRYYQKYQSARNVRKRQLSRNKLLVDELSAVLPANRAKLTTSFVQGLKRRTGFSLIEIFRKYLWFLLRERKFDQGAVDDLVALKHAAGLKDDDVAEALRERSQRIYDKYGTLMLNTEGMTDQGVQRKAACQALFRKLLYLTEHEPLVKAGGTAAGVVDLRKIFGATDEDTNNLRIVSLYEDVDLEKAYGMTISIEDDEDNTSAVPPKRTP